MLRSYSNIKILVSASGLFFAMTNVRNIFIKSKL